MVRLGWLPNALTMARCVFAVFVLIGFWQAGLTAADIAQGAASDISREDSSRLVTLQMLWYQFAFFAFLAGALTDFLDGWLARKLNAHSRFGVFLDPIADKLLIAAALLGLAVVMRSWLIYLPAAAIIARDTFMTWLRATPKGKSVVVPSNLAKWKTGFEMAAIIGLMLPLAIMRGDAVSVAASPSSLLDIIILVALVGLLWVAAFLSLATGWQYMKAASQST